MLSSNSYCFYSPKDRAVDGGKQRRSCRFGERRRRAARSPFFSCAADSDLEMSEDSQ